MADAVLVGHMVLVLTSWLLSQGLVLEGQGGRFGFLRRSQTERVAGYQAILGSAVFTSWSSSRKKS